MKFVPYPYQQYCIDRIISDPAIGLFLDMGLGKTVITLSAIKDLRYNRWEVSKPLIIAPKKVAEATWTTEAAKWDQLKMMRVVPVLGTVQQRLRALATPADAYVINRENVTWLVEHFKKCVAVRHGGAGREFELQELPEQAVQVPAAGPQQDSQNRGADRHSIQQRP